MNKIRNHGKELILLTILLAVAVSVVNAAVFVYYPISITAEWTAPHVYLALGENANDPDLGETNTIQVSIDDDGTSATITVHPCKRQKTIYHDILQIHNDDDDDSFYVWIYVTSQNLPQNVYAKLLIDSQEIDLKTSGSTLPITLSANSYLTIGLKFEVLQGSVSGTSNIALNLVYSNQDAESPPSP